MKRNLVLQSWNKNMTLSQKYLVSMRTQWIWMLIRRSLMNLTLLIPKVLVDIPNQRQLYRKVHHDFKDKWMMCSPKLNEYLEEQRRISKEGSREVLNLALVSNKLAWRWSRKRTACQVPSKSCHKSTTSLVWAVLQRKAERIKDNDFHRLIRRRIRIIIWTTSASSSLNNKQKTMNLETCLVMTIWSLGIRSRSQRLKEETSRSCHHQRQ